MQKVFFLCFNVQYKLNFNLVNSIVLVAEQLIYYREKAHTPTILALHKCSILSSLRKCVCKTKCNEVLTEALFQRNYGTVFCSKTFTSKVQMSTPLLYAFKAELCTIQFRMQFIEAWQMNPQYLGKV